MHQVRMTLNGESIQETIEARTLLVDFLREKMLLTGTHIGCDTGNCGACTIIVNGLAIKSCMMLAVEANGSDIVTVEGLAKNGKLDTIQEAFWNHHGAQCAFCTPGMMMAAKAFLMRNPNPTRSEILRGIEGNICRCTGYTKIIEAIEDAAQQMKRPR